ncbi:MAG: hypothetical protein AAGA48_21995 [Myxococcota bacterium]
MATRQPPRHSPPDLRELAHRPSIDPAEMPTQGADLPIDAWPVEVAEVELLPSTTEAEIPAIPQLGLTPMRRRSPIPILTADQARDERRRSPFRWFLNLGVAALALGLLGGISFALAAVWFIEPTRTEAWFADTQEWITNLAIPEVSFPAGLATPSEPNSAEPEPVPTAVQAAPPPPSLSEDLQQAAAADGSDVLDTEEEEPPVITEPLEPEPEPVVAPAPEPRPRLIRRYVPPPTPTAGPKPVPTVKPYAERPRPVPGEQPPQPKASEGLLDR